MTASQQQKGIEETFLNYVRQERMPVTVFLVNGVKLQGVITWNDDESLLLTREGMTQMIYKHAVSTVMPVDPMDVSDIVGDDHGNL